ncbi:hypothetical protein CDEF62S_00473 [Castellaniella defragrans]
MHAGGIRHPQAGARTCAGRGVDAVQDQQQGGFVALLQRVEHFVDRYGERAGARQRHDALMAHAMRQAFQTLRVGGVPSHARGVELLDEVLHAGVLAAGVEVYVADGVGRVAQPCLHGVKARQDLL